MEEITSEVSKIENSLKSSKYQLRTLETNAKSSIGSEVDGIRSSLKNVDSQVVSVTAQVRSFLSQIDYTNEVEASVDMKPQMVWLRDNLQVIVNDLDTAKAKANDAIQCTEQYSYKVMDVGEEVDSSRHKLTEYHDEAATLEEQAKSSLNSSESMLKYTQSQIERNEREIRERTAEAAPKRQRKASLETDLANNHQQVARLERERKDRKEQAAVGVGLGVLGILAAPFTGGASLALTVGGGGLAGYKAGRVDDFQKEADSYRQSTKSLSTEISQNVQAVAALEREKTRLQSLVSQPIEEADRVKGEIATLKRHALATKENVVQALPQLHRIKQSLEQYSILVKERSLNVSTSNTFMERFTGSLPIADDRIKKPRKFKKQRLLLEQASETLDQIHAYVPGLLSIPGDVRFLYIKALEL